MLYSARVTCIFIARALCKSSPGRTFHERVKNPRSTRDKTNSTSRQVNELLPRHGHFLPAVAVAIRQPPPINLPLCSASKLSRARSNAIESLRWSMISCDQIAYSRTRTGRSRVRLRVTRKWQGYWCRWYASVADGEIRRNAGNRKRNGRSEGLGGETVSAVPWKKSGDSRASKRERSFGERGVGVVKCKQGCRGGVAGESGPVSGLRSRHIHVATCCRRIGIEGRRRRRRRRGGETEE